MSPTCLPMEIRALVASLSCEATFPHVTFGGVPIMTQVGLARDHLGTGMLVLLSPRPIDTRSHMQCWMRRAEADSHAARSVPQVRESPWLPQSRLVSTVEHASVALFRGAQLG